MFLILMQTGQPKGLVSTHEPLAQGDQYDCKQDWSSPVHYSRSSAESITTFLRRSVTYS